MCAEGSIFGSVIEVEVMKVRGREGERKGSREIQSISHLTSVEDLQLMMSVEIRLIACCHRNANQLF